MDRFKRTKIQYQVREAQRYLQIAKQQLRVGERESAEKLYSTAKAYYDQSEKEFNEV